MKRDLNLIKFLNFKYFIDFFNLFQNVLKPMEADTITQMSVGMKQLNDIAKLQTMNFN